MANKNTKRKNRIHAQQLKALKPLACLDTHELRKTNDKQPANLPANKNNKKKNEHDS
jgi:hypothetical protein